MNIYKLDLKTMPEELLLKTIDYFSSIVINNMFIPGQVETWIFIMDLNGESLSNIPLKLMKNIVSYLVKKTYLFIYFRNFYKNKK